MKNTHSLVLSVSTLKDIDKITEDTKYINIDITNSTHDVIDYFLKNGDNFLYSEIIENNKGYIYVGFEDFCRAETIISAIYADMPDNLTKLEIARYLYVSVAKRVFFDINIIPEKNESYCFSLTSKINNIWGSLSLGRVTKSSASKIYYYLCKRLDLNITIDMDPNKELYNKIIIDKLVLNVNLFDDIPYIQANMKTKYFPPYDSDLDLDKKIKYIKNKYTNTLIDTALKNVDYIDENCVEDILYKTQDIIDIKNIKAVELKIIYEYIFNKYCPNYNIKINNLFFVNDNNKNHFIMISYNNEHFSYDYDRETFIKIEDLNILNNLHNGRVGLYTDEIIPNIKINLNA